MTPLFKKLNLGPGHPLCVLNAPASFEAELSALDGIPIHRQASGKRGFAVAFVTTLAEVDQAVAQLAADTTDDPTLWMAYPKASSRRYRCEFNRDTGWAALGRAGYEPVRQVAIDEDWSALRFRKVEHIRTMKRHPDGALTAAGRVKAREHRGA